MAKYMTDNWLALAAAILGEKVTVGQVLLRLGIVERKYSVRKKRLYQLVTNDELELPLGEAMECKKLAEKLGISTDTVRYYTYDSYAKRVANRCRENKKRHEYKIVAVYDDEDDDD